MKVLVAALSVWGLGLMVLAQQGGPGAGTNPLANNAAAAAEGRALYAKICQSCHGPAGEGGGDRGPSLTRTRLTHGNGDADLFRAIRSGIPGTQMPPFAAALSETQTWQLVAHLRTLQGPASTVAADTTPPPATLAPGKRVFLGRAGCATCHQVNGRGGVVGPDLTTAGRLSPAALRQKIVDPNAPGGGSRGRWAGRSRRRRPP